MIKTIELYTDGDFYNLKDLVLDNYAEERNCFIGQVGDGPKDSLYVVLYDSIALLRNPYKVWANPYCAVEVQRFVDIDVFIGEAQG